MTESLAFAHLIPKPLFTGALPLPCGAYVFTITGGTVPAVVYRDAYLKVPFTSTVQTGFTADSSVTADSFDTSDGGSGPGGSCTVYADAAGNFPPIYLDPSVVYCVELYTGQGQLVYTVDPYIVPFPALGNGAINVNALTGEVQINAPLPGGVGYTLRINPNSTYSLQIPGATWQTGQAAMQFINTLGTGLSTPSFVATNKPGPSTSGPTAWLPILGDGNAPYYLPLFS